MVRLTSRSFLHLMPEMVEFDVEFPFYAKVVQLGSEEVTFRSLEGGEGRVDRSVAEGNVVLAGEVSRSGRTSLLRRSVSVNLAGEVHYGQVVAVDKDRRTIQSGGHQFHSVVAEVSAVPPIVALLLEDAEFNKTEWSSGDLEALEQSILSRVLGIGESPASNKVAVILEGLMAEESYPVGTKLCRWADPKTGESTRFPLQHAIDFAYYVDGGASPVPQSVGTSFCRCPSSPTLPSTSSRSRSSLRDVQELFDPFSDDDNSPHEEIEGDSSVETPKDTTARSQKRSREAAGAEIDDEPFPAKKQRCQVALDQDALIMAKISDDPDLLERFLAIRKEAKSREQSNAQSEGGGNNNSGVQKPTPSTKVKATAKYAFAPSEDQELVHERVTSEKYKGKSANGFCRGMVRSEHVEFKALPGVCTRTYDIRFGSGGLSIWYFARLSRDERVTWLESGGSNFDNLSATAEFSAATPATRIEDVADAVRVFLTYTREFCCIELIELVENIVKFIEHTLSQVSWTAKELSSLVYWVNDVLEDFRDAADTGGDLRVVSQRCSTDDRLLRDVMFVKLHRQVDDVRQEMKSGPERSERQSAPRPVRHNDLSHDGKKRFGRIPKDVLRKLPVQIEPGTGKSRKLCMRYLSQAGCTVDSEGGCPSEHGHFVPSTLPQVVKSEISRRFGGLKDEHKQL